MDIVKNLTFYINNDQVSTEIMESFRRRSTPTPIGKFASYADGSAWQRSPGVQQIDVALYVDDVDPLNALGDLALLPYFFVWN